MRKWKTINFNQEIYLVSMIQRITSWANIFTLSRFHSKKIQIYARIQQDAQKQL